MENFAYALNGWSYIFFIQTEEMKMNSAGVDLIKHFESCKLTAYQDQNGIYTIGWGHTAGVKKGDKWTQDKADNTLLNDIDEF